MSQFTVLVGLVLVAALATQGRSTQDIESRLLGSKDSEKKSHIYHVAITRTSKVPGVTEEQYVGSGALLSHRWLVTSARVAKLIDSWFYTAQVKAGLERLQWEPVQTVDVEKVVIHEFYTGKDTDNDIALVKVKGPGFILNERVGVVAIATEDPAPNGQIVVTGWHAAGKEKKPLQELSLDLKDRKSCGEAFGNENLVDETLFCVENTASRAVCANDYGSPAVTFIADREVLVGIFSMTKAPEAHELCGTYPAVFTNIAYYNSWIGSNLS